MFLRNSAILVLSQSMSWESKCSITMETSFSCLDTREYKAEYMTKLSDRELDAYLWHHTLKNIHTSTEIGQVHKYTHLSNPAVIKVFNKCWLLYIRFMIWTYSKWLIAVQYKTDRTSSQVYRKYNTNP